MLEAMMGGGGVATKNLVAFSTDALISGSNTKVYDLDSETLIHEDTVKWVALKFSPDGNYLASVTSGGGLRIKETETWTEVALVQVGPISINNYATLSWSQDSNEVTCNGFVYNLSDDDFYSLGLSGVRFSVFAKREVLGTLVIAHNSSISFAYKSSGSGRYELDTVPFSTDFTVSGAPPCFDNDFTCMLVASSSAFRLYSMAPFGNILANRTAASGARGPLIYLPSGFLISDAPSGDAARQSVCSEIDLTTVYNTGIYFDSANEANNHFDITLDESVRAAFITNPSSETFLTVARPSNFSAPFTVPLGSEPGLSLALTNSAKN